MNETEICAELALFSAALLRFSTVFCIELNRIAPHYIAVCCNTLQLIGTLQVARTAAQPARSSPAISNHMTLLHVNSRQEKPDSVRLDSITSCCITSMLVQS